MASTDSHKLGKEDGNFILPERTFGQGHSEEPTFCHQPSLLTARLSLTSLATNQEGNRLGRHP